MSIDPEALLDALALGLSIAAAADRFGLRKDEVRAIVKEDADRCCDGEELRLEWSLTARRLRRLELAFNQKALRDLDCTAAIVSIKASERRASLVGANAPIAHSATIMQAKALEEQPNTTEQWRRLLDDLRNPAMNPVLNSGQEPPDEPD